MNLARSGVILATVSMACLLAACSADSPRAAPARVAPPRQQDEARPAALVDGESIQWSELVPLMAESGGGAVLQEVVLDHRLAREMQDRAIGFPGGESAAVAAERALFLRTLLRADTVSIGGKPLTADDAERLLVDARRARGLGEQRFTALLRRSAMLRALVRDDVQLDETTVQTAFNIRYGEKRRCRIIVMSRLSDLAAVRDTLLAPGADRASTPLAVRFAEAAAIHSTDPSARATGGGLSGGGAMEPFSTLDLTYPASIRDAATALLPDQLSPVIALDRGFALLLLESIEPPSATPIQEVRTQVEQDLRMRLERVLMDSLVTRLLGQGGVTIFDRSLNWSWEGLAKAPPRG